MTTITTKFRVGDLVWYMRSNNAVQGQISSIHIEITDKNISVEYKGMWIGTQWGFANWEYSCFASKQELLNSL